MRPSRSLSTALLLGAALAATACESKATPVAEPSAIAQTNAAASAARHSNSDVSASREALARTVTDTSADIARQTVTDAVFIGKRDEVLAQGRANLRALELGIEALRARAPGVKDPAKLRGALAAVAAAQPLASDAVDAVAIATPETWEVRRASVETTFAALDTAYRGAVDAAK